MNENYNINRRRSFDPDKSSITRKKDNNFRIHIHSTKASSRDKSFITTDSLKLYEDQIIIKNQVLNEVDEMALQKRPLSLCFDLNSSGEEINNTDTSSSTMSSVSSSSSSSSNSKPSVSNSSSNYHSFEMEIDKYCDEESIPPCRTFALDEDLSNESFNSMETTSSSSKETSISTVLEVLELNGSIQTHNNCHNIDVIRPYDFSSSDSTDNDSDKSLVLECNSPSPIHQSCVNSYNQIRFSMPETEVPVKEMQEIIKTFNSNSCGMDMYEDNKNRLCCILKVFVNLTEPVKLDVPTQLPNTSLVSSKTLLPRGGFELVTIDRTTTCKQIIDQIFAALHIQENYSNYGLFEHTIREGDKVIVKRLGYDYCLMSHLINMVRIQHDSFSTSFSNRRFVLQESERVEINWSKFSDSELRNFLKILEKEQEDRRKKITVYYENIKQSIRDQMDQIKMKSK